MDKIIYAPKGRAAEYCKLAVNLYKGCCHGCTYCYVPNATFSKPCAFYENVSCRKNIIEKLEKDAEVNQGKGEYVLLSFSSDPYQKIDEAAQLTRQAIKILKNNNYKIMILSKAGTKVCRDFDLLDGEDFVGATLTMDNEKNSKSWEPSAALPDDRIEMLRRAKEAGLKTWVSLEPVLYPEQTLRLIDLTYKFVDLYKVGVLNHHPRAKEIDWKKFAKDVVKKLDEKKKNYYIKKDLKKFL